MCCLVHGFYSCLFKKKEVIYFFVIFVKYFHSFHPKDVFENISVVFVTTQYVLYLWHKLGKHNPINCFKTKANLHTKINSHQGLVRFLGLGLFRVFWFTKTWVFISPRFLQGWQNDFLAKSFTALYPNRTLRAHSCCEVRFCCVSSVCKAL